MNLTTQLFAARFVSFANTIVNPEFRTFKRQACYFSWFYILIYGGANRQLDGAPSSKLLASMNRIFCKQMLYKLCNCKSNAIFDLLRFSFVST